MDKAKHDGYLRSQRDHLPKTLRSDCRPRSYAEKKAGSLSVVETSPKKGEVQVKVKDTGDKSSTKTFTFDKVFSPSSSQILLYKEVVSPIIGEVLQGYNCTVFA